MADFNPGTEIFTEEAVPQSLALPEALQPPTQLVGPVFMAGQAFLNAIIWATIIPIQSLLLPIQVAGLDPTNKVPLLSLVTLIGGIAALIGPPISGAFSDRTTGRFGRRRPWILGCAIGAAVGMLLMATAQSIALLALGYVIFGLMVNMVLIPTLATIPDLVPVQQRATVSAFVGLAQPVGTLLGTIVIAQITRSPQISYAVLSISFVILAVLFVLTVTEKPLPRGTLPPFSLASFLRTFVVHPFKNRDFCFTWFARFFAILSQVTFSVFLLYFLQDVVHYGRLFPGQTPAQGVAIFQMIYTLLLIIATLVGGIISDRLQRRKIFIIVGNLLMALAALLMAIFLNWTFVVITAAIFGFGFGLYISADVALVSQVLPKVESQGKDFGLIMSANVIPLLLLPVISSLAFGVFHGYAALYVICGVGAFLAALLIIPIRGVH